MADEPPALLGRRVAGAHADGRGARTSTPRRSAASAMPASGARRFFSTSTASAAAARCRGPGVRSAFGGTGVGARAGRWPTGTRRASCPSRWGRAASAWSPCATAAHPAACAAVGAGNDASNQARTGGENGRRQAGGSGIRRRGADHPSVPIRFRGMNQGRAEGIWHRGRRVPAVPFGRPAVPRHGVDLRRARPYAFANPAHLSARVRARRAHRSPTTRLPPSRRSRIGRDRVRGAISRLAASGPGGDAVPLPRRQLPSLEAVAVDLQLGTGGGRRLRGRPRRERPQAGRSGGRRTRCDP